MKQLLIILFFLPILGLAQTPNDYTSAIAKFFTCYNNMQGDKIVNMWPENLRDDWTRRTWGEESLKSMHQEYGKILSYEYIGIDTDDPNPQLAVFKTQFSIAGWKTTSFTLDKDNYFNTFRFITTSDGIDKMLKNRE